MHVIEPFFSWRHHYVASEDPDSPFYGRTFSEIEFSHAIYNYLIHPQWDLFGSATLVSKVLYADYQEQFAIIELLGEWNDCLYNDIMFLKNNIVDSMLEKGIRKFIFIGENVLNFHAGDDDYYQEWFDSIIGEGYIYFLAFQDHVALEFIRAGLDDYLFIPEAEDDVLAWRTYEPINLKNKIEANNGLPALLIQ